MAIRKKWACGYHSLGIVKVTSMAHMTHNSFVHFIFGGTFLLLFIDALERVFRN